MDSSASSRRRPCFVEEDDGLASLAEMEAGFSGNHEVHQHQQSNHHLIARPIQYGSALQRRNSLRNLSSPPSNSILSPRSGRFYDARFEEHNQQPHFLEACFLCKKHLGDKQDIFMYRGDTPFCSEECRQEQIEMDEAKEKSWNLSASMKALRKKEKRKSDPQTQTTQDYPFHTSTVAAA